MERSGSEKPWAGAAETKKGGEAEEPAEAETFLGLTREMLEDPELALVVKRALELRTLFSGDKGTVTEDELFERFAGLYKRLSQGEAAGILFAMNLVRISHLSFSAAVKEILGSDTEINSVWSAHEAWGESYDSWNAMLARLERAALGLR